MNNRLYRSTSEQVLGGVAAGIARRLNIDPLIVRGGFVLGALLTHGLLLLVYLVLWAVLPTAGSTATDVSGIARENMNEAAARFGFNPPAAPQAGPPPAPAAPVASSSAPATPAWDGRAIGRAVILLGLAFLLLKFVGFGALLFSPHHMGGGLFWPLLLLLGAFWFFRRHR